MRAAGRVEEFIEDYKEKQEARRIEEGKKLEESQRIWMQQVYYRGMADEQARRASEAKYYAQMQNAYSHGYPVNEQTPEEESRWKKIMEAVKKRVSKNA
jgi:hypothetical protein